MKHNPLIGIIVVLLVITDYSLAATNNAQTRIFWDRTTIVSPCVGGYARVKELSNGELMLVYSQGYHIYTRHSQDYGRTWGPPKQVSKPVSEGTYNTNSEAIQLSDGTVIYGWNQRPSVEDPNIPFAIKCAISSDNGHTFGSDITIFNGSYKFEDGCWEPAFLELPNGDVQCYFADETKYVTSGSQEIVCCTSKDKGKTWGERVTVCYRKIHRDGMPVPLLSADKKNIMVVIEDYGIPYSRWFCPSIVRTTVEDSWQSGYVTGDSPQRNAVIKDAVDGKLVFGNYYDVGFYGAAPYLCRLSTGDIAVSCQSNVGGRSCNDIHELDMAVLIGDPDGRHFYSISRPFPTQRGHAALWNSLLTLKDGSLLACTTYDDRVLLCTGYPMQQASANYCPIQIDGQRGANEQWTQNGEQLIFGNDKRWTADLSYSKHYLNLLVQAKDDDLMDGDGITLVVDGRNNTTTPNKGCIKLWANKNGDITLYNGTAGQWRRNLNTKGLWCKTAQIDGGWLMELAVPWCLIGVDNPSNRTIKMAIERKNQKASGITIESTPDAKIDQPSTWLPVVTTTMPEDVPDNADRFSYDNLNLEEAIKETPHRDYNRRELLYPNGNPDDNGFTAADEYLSNGWWYKVAVPWMEIYIPEGEVKGTILTIPGGGYGGESYYQIGEKAADFFLPQGYAVAALKYRLPNGHDWIPLEDACQAMEMLRNNQVAWGLGHGPIGCFGESAGGHLAASLATKFRSQNARPDFSILLYPVISLENGVTHVGTRDCLLGGDQSQARIDAWSLHKQVNTNTSPCFITACQDDDVVPVINSVMMYQALTQQKVKSQLCLMPAGLHGWAINGGIWQDNVVQTALMEFLKPIVAATYEPSPVSKLRKLTPDGCVVNVTPGMATYKAKTLTVAGNDSKGYKTYFAAWTAETGEELWVTDGRQSTHMVRDITPGCNGSDIQWITPFNDKVLFRANRQLWISDGTEVGTYEIKNNDGASMFDPLGMTQLNETQFVFGSWINGYHALYVSDGSQDGTQMIYSYEDAPGFFTLWPGEMTNEQGKQVMGNIYMRVGNKVFFKGVTDASGEELWVTDGTKAGTHMVKEINTENNNKGGAAINWMTNYKDQKLFFKAWSLEHGNRMWVTDGTEAGTKECVTTPATSPNWYGPSAVYKDKIYISAYSEADGRGVELFAADENGNMTLVADINPSLIKDNQWGSFPVCMGVFDGYLMIQAQNPAESHQLFRFDGTNLVKVNGVDICFADNGYTIVNGTYYNYGLVNGQWGVFTMNHATDYPNPSLPYIGFGTSADGQLCGYNMRDCGGVMVFSFVYGDWTQNADNRGIWAYSYKKE